MSTPSFKLAVARIAAHLQEDTMKAREIFDLALALTVGLAYYAYETVGLIIYNLRGRP